MSPLRCLARTSPVRVMSRAMYPMRQRRRVTIAPTVAAAITAPTACRVAPIVLDHGYHARPVHNPGPTF